MRFHVRKGMGVVDANGEMVGEVTRLPEDGRVFVARMAGEARLVPMEAVARVGDGDHVYLAVGLPALADLPVERGEPDEAMVRRAHEALGLTPRTAHSHVEEVEGVRMRVAGDDLPGTPSYTLDRRDVGEERDRD